MTEKKHNIGLVLSGGGARGFAHLGAYKALEEKGIKPDIISGTSAGAIIGAFLADGKSADEVFKILSRKSLFQYSTFRLFKSGLVRLEGLKDDIRNYISVKNIEDLAIPFVIAMTNISKGEIEYKRTGDIARNVLASSSIPVIFTPMKMKNQLYVDGGLFDNLPVTPIRNICKTIIGINISPTKEENGIEGILGVSGRIFELTTHANTVKSMPMCDILVEPMDLTEFTILETDKAKEMYEIGYKAALNTDFSTLK